MMATKLRLAIDPREARPIWRQIEEGLTSAIASGHLLPGEAVPSVRELARELRVNPATIAKAYRRLAEVGLVEMRRGAGTFVTQGPPRLSPRERHDLLVEAAGRLMAVAAAIGADREEVLAALSDALSQLEDTEKVAAG